MPIYDPTVYTNGQYTVNPSGISTRMNDFLAFTEYDFVKKTNDYNILADFFGPMYFNPMHC